MDSVPPEVTAKIEAFFHGIEADGWQPYLGTASGVVAFDIVGVGLWFVTIEDGGCTVVRGGIPTAPPDHIYRPSPEVFLRRIRRREESHHAADYARGHRQD